jgi:hypothetical protein
MVLLPFLAGALVAGNAFQWRVLSAALTVLSVFVLREPLVFAIRKHLAAKKGYRQTPEVTLPEAKQSLVVYGAAGLAAASVLPFSLPLLPLALLGTGATGLLLLSVVMAAHNQQRSVSLQLVGVAGLTSSALLAYLSALGRLDERAFWVWGLCLLHSAASVLMVRARLERLGRGKRAGAETFPQKFWWSAVSMQAALGVFFVFLVASGRSWILLPFLAPALLHGWEMLKLRNLHQRPSLSMQQVGLLQLGASIVFCLLLVAVLR